MEKVLIVGIGNPFRSDDAVGTVVIQQLREFASPRLAVRELSGEGSSLINAWSGYSSVYLIDAVCSGAPVGTIHRLDLRTKEDLERYSRAFSTHDFGVGGAVELAKALDKLPPKLVLYGIEGDCFSPGIDLSPEVLAAVPSVIRLVLEETFRSPELDDLPGIPPLTDVDAPGPLSDRAV